MPRKVSSRYHGLIKYVKSALLKFNPESAFELLLAMISSELDADCCLLINKYEEILFESPILNEKKFSHTILKKALKQKRSILIKNALQEDNLKQKESIFGNIFLSVICVILHDKKGKIAGALYLDRHRPEKDFFTELDLEEAEDFVDNFTNILIKEGIEKREFTRLREAHGFEGIIGKSKIMQELFVKIDAVAGTDTNVFLQGRTGTGKELVARAIHRRSKRADNPFVAVNCSAIPKDLIESELFGHIKGAFTGASNNRAGKFIQANGGTLFLDEIGDLDMDLQTKLLRALQEREIQAVGSDEIIKIDIRLITASSKDIINEIKKEHFRKELFYRINSYPIFLPPLKDRGEDIILLAEHFLKKYCELNYNYISPPYFTEKARKKLLNYSWEGNVRELQNTMENVSVSCRDIDIIDAYHLQFYPIEVKNNSPKENASLKEIAEQAELEAVKKSLAKHRWNRKKVAAELNTTYPTLAKIIEKYKLKED